MNTLPCCLLEYLTVYSPQQYDPYLNFRSDQGNTTLVRCIRNYTHKIHNIQVYLDPILLQEPVRSDKNTLVAGIGHGVFG